jgi:hypothetical protein
MPPSDVIMPIPRNCRDYLGDLDYSSVEENMDLDDNLGIQPQDEGDY